MRVTQERSRRGLRAKSRSHHHGDAGMHMRGNLRKVLGVLWPLRKHAGLHTPQLERHAVTGLSFSKPACPPNTSAENSGSPPGASLWTVMPRASLLSLFTLLPGSVPGPLVPCRKDPADPQSAGACPGQRFPTLPSFNCYGVNPLTAQK